MATATKDAPGGIYKKILEIQKKITGLEKNGVGPATQGAYKFLSVDDVLARVKPLLDEQGVFVHAELVDKQVEFTKANAKDDSRVPKVATVVFVTYRFRFVDAEDGSFIETVVLGEGADSSDKATRKATTSAWKIALMQTFTLITGEGDIHDQGDGANVEDKGSNGGAPRVSGEARKIEKAQQPNEVETLRAQLKQIGEAQGRDFTGDILPFGDRISGVNRAVWTKDVLHLQKIIKALEDGEA